MLERDDLTQKLRGYLHRSHEYLRNAYSSIDQGELEKGGEFLWGSMAQAIKAVAASKEIELRTHRDVWNYARALSMELGDQDLFHAFRDANYLHGNFYEAGLALDVVLDYGERIRHAVGKLLRLIPAEALAQ